MYETADHHISTYAIFFRLVPVEMTATPSHMSVNCLGTSTYANVSMHLECLYHAKILLFNLAENKHFFTE